MHIVTSADVLEEAAIALQAASEVSGTCTAMQDVLAADAVVLVSAPASASAWTCSYERGLTALHLIEIAAAGDFGYTVAAGQAGDSAAWHVLVWRQRRDSSWRVEAAMRTVHLFQASDGGPVTRAGRGWARAGRPLYQEAARVAMLKADRDMAAISMGAGSTVAYGEALSDSALYLRAGERPLSGRQRSLKWIRHQPGMVTWVPVGGAVARAGDLGYTYGMQTVRPPPPDTLLLTRAYLRLWRARPDSTWQIAVEVQGKASRAGM